MSLLQRRRELFSLLSWHMHHEDWCPGDTLLRLIEKATGSRPRRGKIVVSEASFKIEQLAKLQVDAHSNSEPDREDVPIVLFRDEFRDCRILDGQNRINRWRAIGKEGPFRCLAVRIR